MKLTDATLYVKRCETGAYNVIIFADYVDGTLTNIKKFEHKYELPSGPRPPFEDLGNLLRMVAEELSR